MDDVVAEVGFNDVAGFAGLEAKGHVFKRLHHRAAAEEIKIPAALGRAWVI